MEIQTVESKSLQYKPSCMKSVRGKQILYFKVFTTVEAILLKESCKVSCLELLQISAGNNLVKNYSVLSSPWLWHGHIPYDSCEDAYNLGLLCARQHRIACTEVQLISLFAVEVPPKVSDNNLELLGSTFEVSIILVTFASNFFSLLLSRPDTECRRGRTQHIVH